LVGQGATEYLVLLAVVLIVALVSVALLGFFPGMASDAQIAQSQTYWQSAQPISIIESGAVLYRSDGAIYPYLRVKNTGGYPIRITGVVGADGNKATTYSSSLCGDSGGTISSFFYLAPGEDKYFASSSYGLPCNRYVMAVSGGSSLNVVGGASSLCQNSSSSPGTLDYKSFGFEYIMYIDGQQITKRQIGKELIIKCREPA